MDIVKFKDGWYGIRKGRRWFGGYQYVNHLGDFWFSEEEYVEKHCKFSYNYAMELYRKLTAPRTEPRDYGTPLDELYQR